MRLFSLPTLLSFVQDLVNRGDRGPFDHTFDSICHHCDKITYKLQASVFAGLFGSLLMAVHLILISTLISGYTRLSHYIDWIAPAADLLATYRLDYSCS